MNTILKKHKVLFIAFGMVICMTAALGAGIGVSRSIAEKDVVKASMSNDNLPDNMDEIETQSYDQASLYKDVVMDAEITKKVCEKYNLDYNTVKVEDVTQEMRNYEEALWLLKSMRDQPLLASKDNTEEMNQAFHSLEGYLCDIYAFSGGKDVIIKMCKQYGIHPEQAKISDLTEDQLIEIGKEAFQTSDHPQD